MEINQIRAFLRVAELRSFTAAAKQLNITQPALSRQVQSLEDELGTQLLLRSTRGVRPTDPGKVMMEMGSNLLNYLESIQKAVVHAASDPKGEVVVGLPPSLSGCLTPLLIETCRQSLPQVRLRIVEGLSVFMENWLTLDRMDLAVMTYRQNLKMLQTPLCAESFVLVRRRSKAQGACASIHFQDLAHVPLVMTHGFKEILSQQLPPGMFLQCDAEIDSITALCNLVASSELATLLPSSIVEQEKLSERFDVQLIHSPVPQRSLVIGRNPGRPSSAATRAVQQVIFQCIQHLPMLHAER